MSTYTVIKTIKGRRYRYRQTTWREGGRMRTKSEYLGRVDEQDVFAHARVGGGQTIPKSGYLPKAQEYVNEWGIAEYSDRAQAELYARDLMLGEGGRWEAAEVRRGAWRAHRISDFLKDLVRKPDRDVETESELQERLAAEDAERARNDHVNDLLTADTISLDAVSEIADMQAEAQNEGESEDSPDGDAEASAE